MTLTSQLTLATDVSHLADMMRRRLLGADLGEPYLHQQGERPEDVLIELFLASDSEKRQVWRQMFDEAMALLVRDEVHSLLRDLAAITPTTDITVALGDIFSNERLLYSRRLCRVAENTCRPTDWRLVRAWALTVFVWMKEHPGPIHLFGYIMPCLASALHEEPVAVRSFCRDAMGCDRAVGSILRTLAAYDPDFLASEIIPQLMRRLVENVPDSIESASAARILDTLSSMFLGSGDPSARTALASALILSAVKHCADAPGGILHQLIFDALTSASLGPHALKFDNDVWERRFTTSDDPTPVLPSEWNEWIGHSQIELGERLKVGRSRRANADPIRIGAPHFAESALVLLFARVAERLLEIPFKVGVIGWTHVGKALIEHKIDLGLHNGLMVENLERSPHLFTFFGYDLVANKEWARGLLAERSQSHTASPLLTAALSGEPLSPGVGLDEMGRRELSEILARGRLGLPLGTDIGARVTDFLRANGASPLIEDLDEEEGLRELIAGRIQLYAGGANHAFYATRRYPRICCTLLTLAATEAEGSPNTFVATPGFEKRFGVSLSLLADIWYDVAKVWLAEFQDRSTTSRRLAPHNTLTTYLTAWVNHFSAANLWTFSELIQVLKLHDHLFTATPQRTRAIKNAESTLRRAHLRSVKGGRN